MVDKPFVVYCFGQSDRAWLAKSVKTEVRNGEVPGSQEDVTRGVGGVVDGILTVP